MPEIYVKGEFIPCVNEIVYLRNVIKNDRREYCEHFNCKFNSSIDDFVKVSYFNNNAWDVMALRTVLFYRSWKRDVCIVLQLPFHSHSLLAVIPD